MTALTSTSYTARDYNTARAELSTFIAKTKGAAWSDYFDGNLGTALIDLFSAVIDIGSWTTDAALLEAFLSQCRRYESALYFASSVGYVPRAYTSATAQIRSTSTLPQVFVNNGAFIKAGSSVRGSNGLSYEVVEDTTFVAGTSVLRLNVKEGTTYTEVFQASAGSNYTVTSQQGQVEQDSWSVYVGDPSNPSNLWVQVDNVLLELSATPTYDVSFDADSRLIVRFGDGTAGAIPPQAITVVYRTSNGVKGNTPAQAISGSIRVYDSTNLNNVTSVTFSNYEATAASAGAPQIQTGEIVGDIPASSTVNGLLAHAPVTSGTLKLSLTLSTGATLTLQADADGYFTQTASTGSPPSLVTTGGVSRLFANTGAYVLVFSSTMPAGGNVQASYTYSLLADPLTTTVTGAASGGADRESLDELKRNIPRYIRTPTTVVSLKDYANAINRIGSVARSGVRVTNSPGSYTRNLVEVYAWSSETVNFASTSSSNALATTTYKRFTKASQYTTYQIQTYLREHSMLSLQHVSMAPELLWVDLYLGQVRYDKRVASQTVRQAITDAVINYVQNASGYEIRMADVTSAVVAATGVLSLNIARVAIGHRDVSTEAVPQGSTTGSTVLSGTVALEAGAIISPKTFSINVLQSGNPLTFQDDGTGSLVLTSGTAAINGAQPHTVDYTTGAWTVTLTAAPTTNSVITATYADVINDYRLLLDPIIDNAVSGDQWPPPTLTQSAPVSAPPFRDGLPQSALHYVTSPAPAWMPVTVAAAGSGDQLIYNPMQDIVIESIFKNAYFFDNSFLFNDEILYDSVPMVSYDLRVINLRKLHFDLVPV